jgi:radical SAM protein with 4Fe4S-binding SPASM domain
MLPESFCYLPFGHVLIKTDGSIGICCEYSSQTAELFNIKTHSYSEWWNSKERQTVQQQLLAGEKPAGCQRCYKLEAEGFSSYRTQILKEYKLYKIDINQPKLLSIEADVENLCNLKCMMCNEVASSEILKENKILQINTDNQNRYVWNSVAFDSLEKTIKENKIKLLNLRGGEPLFNKKIKRLLQEIPPEYVKNTLIHITSNMTIWNDEWSEIFSKFRLVRLMASIDGVDKTAEYIRFPSSWNTVAENLYQASKLENTKAFVKCTIQNLNVLYLDNLISWTRKNNLYIDFGLVTDPIEFIYTNLTPELKDIALSRLNGIIDKPDVISKIIDNLTKSKFDEANWDAFVSHVKMKDAYRQINIKNYLPDFQIY